jgi:hypothetical protein
MDRIGRWLGLARINSTSLIASSGLSSSVRPGPPLPADAPGLFLVCRQAI